MKNKRNRRAFEFLSKVFIYLSLVGYHHSLAISTDSEVDVDSMFHEVPVLMAPLNSLLEQTSEELSKLLKSREALKRIFDENAALHKMLEELRIESNDVEKMITDFNQLQIDKFIRRINKTLDDELQRRESVEKVQTELEDSKITDRIRLEDLEDLFDSAESTNQSKNYFTDFVIEKLEDACEESVADFISTSEDLIAEKLNYLEDEFALKQKSTGYCVDPLKASQIIYSSVWNYKENKENRRGLDGISIVYGSEWTSDTYEGIDDQVQYNKSTTRFESLRNYIPEDWERILMLGWEHLNLHIFTDWIHEISPRGLFPSYILHSLPSSLASFIESQFNLYSNAPVETVLYGSNHFGSCWRMPGRSGKVTLRLANPVILTDFSISHYPWLKSAHNPKDFKSHTLSAPRFIRMVGYPPCEQNDSSCEELNAFDVARPMNIGTYEYKVDTSLFDDLQFDMHDEEEIYEQPKSSVQSFIISAIDELTNDENHDDNDEPFASNAGGCSAFKPSCGGDDPNLTLRPISAITIFIDENWGHTDYTCLYKIQLQGREV